MTNDVGVVAQFRVPEEFLLERNNPLGKFLGTDTILRYLSRKRRRAQCRSIRDVWPGINRVSLKAKILELQNQCVLCHTRYGNYASVAKALIWDETGTIRLCLWNEQIGSVSVGDTVRIENARASLFRGERQLSIGTRGLLTSVEDFESQITLMDSPAVEA